MERNQLWNFDVSLVVRLLFTRINPKKMENLTLRLLKKYSLGSAIIMATESFVWKKYNNRVSQDKIHQLM